MKSSNLMLTYTLLSIMISAAGVGWSLALLATGVVTPGIANLIVYGGLFVLIWHEIVDPLWGPWTHKNIAKRKAEQDAWRAHRKERDALAAAKAQAALQEKIDAYDKAAVREHKTWQEEHFEKNIPKQSSE